MNRNQSRYSAAVCLLATLLLGVTTQPVTSAETPTHDQHRQASSNQAGTTLVATAPVITGRGSTGDALDCIFQGGIVEGGVADGVTAINFVFFGLPGPGVSEYFFVDGQAPEDGGFDEPGGDSRLDSITVSTMPGDDGWESVAQYLVPEEFNSGGHEGDAERIVTLRVEYTPDDPDDDPAAAQAPLRLLRPPVVLMHGLWSNPVDAWGASPLRSDARLTTVTGDYSSTNAASFSINTERPARPIREACEFMRADGIAMTQVDYVGHSMGGIVGRNFESFQPDLINKFFTMNTPHTGSPLANLIVAIRDSQPPLRRLLMVEILRAADFPIDEGALDDLSVGSPAIDAIQATPIPSHALVGIGGSDLIGDALAQAPGRVGALFKVLNFIDDTTDLFAGIQHDFIVGRSSQEGGIAAGATTVFDGLDSIHTRATGNPAYSNRVIELLNSPATGSQFGMFPPPSTISTHGPPIPTYNPDQLLGGVIEDGVAIVAPADGTPVAPGEAVSVSVAAQNDFDLQNALVVSRVLGLELNEAPFTGDFIIPDDALGALELTALGADSAGNLTRSEPITLLVETDFELTDIEIVNRDPVMFEADDQRQMYIAGTFSDGVVRNITSPATGTQYSVADPKIAIVSEDGQLTPEREGVTTLTVVNGGLQDSVSVTVQAGQVILADGFES